MNKNIGQILLTKKIINESQLAAALEKKEKEPNKYLGQIFCEMGIPQSKIIKSLYYSNKRRKIGQILVDMNKITNNQLLGILDEQSNNFNKIGLRKPLGTILVEMGVIDENSYMTALSYHFNMPVLSLKDYRINEALQNIIGEEYALQNNIIVLNNTPERVVLVLAEPSLLLIEEIEKSFPTGKNIIFCLAKLSEIKLCLTRRYDLFNI